MIRTMPLASLTAISLCCVNFAVADTPLGWISNENPSAYTQNARTFELSVGAIAVNETIDFLNIRSDLLAGTRKLVGDSGDLKGQRVELHVGIVPSLSVFYRSQQQDLKIELGEISSVHLIDIDDGLHTTSTAYGFKWNFFEAGNVDKSRPWSAASLEVTRTHNSTDNYEGFFDRVRVSNDFSITFADPQTFRMDTLEDDGWQARVLYSMPLSNKLSSSVWVGYGESSATSGTSASIVVPSIQEAFLQRFEMDDRHLMAGASMHWQITPRIPLQLSYEFLRVNNSKTEAVVSTSSSIVPSFLRGDNLGSVSARSNHSLRGSLSYWLTPEVHVSFTGKVFSNQFLGLIPHYNNPLSGSFADNPYGYIGLQLGINL